MASVCYRSFMGDIIYKYGLFRKGDWKAIMLFKTKREAENMKRKQYKGSCEVRKLIK